MQLAGASTGSLIVACIKSGLPFDTIQAACFELARCVTAAVCLACGSCSVSHDYALLCWHVDAGVFPNRVQMQG
jgi:hypothetical protein